MLAQGRLIAFALFLALFNISWDNSGWPRLNYSPVPDWPNLPEGWNFGEVPAVALDASENIYVFNRGPHPLMDLGSTTKGTSGPWTTEVTRCSSSIRPAAS